MDENHQDKAGSKTTATAEVRWVFDKRSKLWVAKHKKRTGFEDKTLWDWLQLLLQLLTALALPIALFVAAQWLSAQQSQSSELASVQQHQTDLQIANDQQQETTLKSYLDDMSDLLLNHTLHNSKPGDEVRQVARARTLTTLRRLKADRNRIVLRFLHDAHLIGIESTGLDLNTADLSGDDLSGADLSDVDLSYDDLKYANLTHADLTRTILTHANLSGANLTSAYIRGADLSNAFLVNAILVNAYLHAALLNWANLSQADLKDADLSSVNLSHAMVTSEQLAGALSLKGATMPDGSTHS